jgi:hypothetical protein
MPAGPRDGHLGPDNGRCSADILSAGCCMAHPGTLPAAVFPPDCYGSSAQTAKAGRLDRMRLRSRDRSGGRAVSLVALKLASPSSGNRRCSRCALLRAGAGVLPMRRDAAAVAPALEQQQAQGEGTPVTEG